MQSPRLHCNLDKPFKVSRCIYCWKVAIAVYVNATYILKKDDTGFMNMGRFGPVLVKPGQIWPNLGLGLFSLKCESFRP